MLQCLLISCFVFSTQPSYSNPYTSPLVPIFCTSPESHCLLFSFFVFSTQPPNSNPHATPLPFCYQVQPARGSVHQMQDRFAPHRVDGGACGTFKHAPISLFCFLLRCEGPKMFHTTRRHVCVVSLLCLFLFVCIVDLIKMKLCGFT